MNIDDNQYVNIMNIIQDYLNALIGKTVTTKGFVYREKEFMQNQIIVARFGITCCVADALGIWNDGKRRGSCIAEG